MNTSIVGRHITLTDDLKSHIERTMSAFDKYNLAIQLKAPLLIDEGILTQNI